MCVSNISFVIMKVQLFLNCITHIYSILLYLNLISINVLVLFISTGCLRLANMTHVCRHFPWSDRDAKLRCISMYIWSKHVD